jgi:hypothetical protein
MSGARRHLWRHDRSMEAILDATEFKPADGLLDNTQVRVGYIAHVAVPCRDLEETARWYADVLGAAAWKTRAPIPAITASRSCAWRTSTG